MDNIVLTGGGALIKGLHETVSMQLNVPTVVGDPFADIKSAKRVNRRTLERDAALFTVAFGLALRSAD